MQNINSKLLEDLKQRKVNLDLSLLTNEKTPSQGKTPQLSSRRGSSPVDNSNNMSSTMGSTSSSKFRVKTINPPTNNLEENASKTSNKLPPRPSTASRNEASMKFSASQTTFKSRPLTTTGRRPSNAASNTSSKGNFARSASGKTSDDDIENDINFVNMDGEDEADEKIREELEIFNDIADLDEQKLAEIVGVDVDTLEGMTRAEMRVDLSFNSLQRAGEILVCLKQLKLNNSIMTSLRDIGNSFLNLRVLYISKCSVKNLAGLSSFPKLQELYAPYNSIKELSDIMFHENLQVLDLEGNEIDNIDTIQNLMGLDQLIDLTLSSNPICKLKNWQQTVLEYLPRLECLNDESRAEISKKLDKYEDKNQVNANYVDNNKISELYAKFEKLDLFSVEDFKNNARELIMSEMAKEPSEEDLIMMSVKKTSKKAKDSIPNEDFGKLSIKATNKKGSSQRPQTSKARLGSKSGSIFTDTDKLKDFGQTASDLILQTDQAFAGNPLKALRHRRKNQFTSGFENVQGESIAKPKDIMKLIEEFEVNDDSDDDDNKKFEDIFATNSLTHQSSEPDLKTQVQQEPPSIGRTNSLSQIQRDLRMIAKHRVLSQEKKEEPEQNKNLSSRELSIQDIRNQLNSSKSRVKIQIKTKKGVTPVSINRAPSMGDVNNS